jgi:uncharacterized membrane protein
MRRRRSTLLWTGVIVLALIGIASVIRRAVFLKAVFATGPSPYNGPTDVGFAAHPLLTLLHIAPGLLFVVLAPMQFVQGIRQSRPALHRWMGRLLLVCGVIVGTSALVMGFLMPIGGAVESAAITVFASLFLFSLWRAFRHIRRREFGLHREWMIRAFSFGFAVATVRPIVGIFFATSRVTHLTPHDFFGAAFWVGFTLQTLVAEVYIRRSTSEDSARGKIAGVLARRYR